MGGRRVRQISSPYWVGGETDYMAQEDLKFINSYNMQGGKDDKVPFFFSVPAFQGPLCCFFFFFPVV